MRDPVITEAVPTQAGPRNGGAQARATILELP